MKILVLSLLLAAGCGVIDNTFETDKVVHDYEWFHDTSEAIEARLPQIATYKEYIADETDPAEVRKLRTELGAMQQSCRDMVSDYNANSKKVNVSIFKGNSAPRNYSLTICE